jgi:hypothetical protein
MQVMKLHLGTMQATRGKRKTLRHIAAGIIQAAITSTIVSRPGRKEMRMAAANSAQSQLRQLAVDQNVASFVGIAMDVLLLLCEEHSITTQGVPSAKVARRSTPSFRRSRHFGLGYLKKDCPGLFQAAVF